MSTGNILAVKRKIYIVIDLVLINATIIGIITAAYVEPQALRLYLYTGIPVVIVLLIIFYLLRDLTKIRKIEIIGLIAIVAYVLVWDVANVMTHLQTNNAYMFSNTPIIVLAGIFMTLALNRRFILAAVLAFFVLHTLLTWINLAHFAWGTAHASQLVTDFVTLAVLLAIILLGEYNAQLLDSQQEASSMRVLANTDALTGLYNRRGMLDLISSRQQQILMQIDLDFFKNINDSYGHEQGDIMLNLVAKVLHNTFWQHAYVARWGGEEFLVALQNIEFDRAVELANQARQQVELQSANTISPLTISMGLALQQTGESIDSAIKRADELLYKAKQNGRNKVAV